MTGEVREVDVWRKTGVARRPYCYPPHLIKGKSPQVESHAEHPLNSVPHVQHSIPCKLPSFVVDKSRFAIMVIDLHHTCKSTFIAEARV